MIVTNIYPRKSRRRNFENIAIVRTALCLSLRTCWVLRGCVREHSSYAACHIRACPNGGELDVLLA